MSTKGRFPYSNIVLSPLYKKHWEKNSFIIYVGNEIALIRYFGLKKPICYKSIARLFNHVAFPTAINDENDKWTDQSVQRVFQQYLALLKITEEDIIRVYPNLHELRIP